MNDEKKPRDFESLLKQLAVEIDKIKVLYPGIVAQELKLESSGQSKDTKTLLKELKETLDEINHIGVTSVSDLR